MSSIACCAGYIDSGTPLGKEEVIAGITCYVAPKSENGFRDDILVVLATDVFGFKLPNPRLMADSFAKELNCKVVVPDLFEGTEVPADLMGDIENLVSNEATFASKAWAVSRLLYYFPPFAWSNPPKKSADRLEKVIVELRSQGAIKKVAMPGYCWGGKCAVLLGQRQGVIDVGVSIHPGGLKIPEDIEALNIPIAFLLTTGKDFQLKEPQMAQIQEILAKKGDSYEHLIKDYPTMHHGFAMRGNEKDPVTLEMRKDAFDVAAGFIKKVLNI
jgi:dienelactone hydrolase